MEVNNEMNVKKEDLKRIFAAYIGCQVIADFNEDYPNCKGYLTGILGEHGAEIQFIVDGNAEESPEYKEYDEVKLLLKPLQYISDEDALGIAAIILYMPFTKHSKGWQVIRNNATKGWPYISIHNPKNIYKLEIDCRQIGFNIYNMEDCITGEHDMRTVEVLDFLREKEYDCGYGKIESLITAGIAIKVDTHHTHPTIFPPLTKSPRANNQRQPKDKPPIR